MFSKLFSALETFVSARRAAAAVEAGFEPQPRDLERLGISPGAFGNIMGR